MRFRNLARFKNEYLDIYSFKDVKNIDIATYMRTYVKRRIIDQALIDIEHAEYPMLPFLLESGELRKAGVIFCQVLVFVSV